MFSSLSVDASVYVHHGYVGVPEHAIVEHISHKSDVRLQAWSHCFPISFLMKKLTPFDYTKHVKDGSTGDVGAFLLDTFSDFTIKV